MMNDTAGEDDVVHITDMLINPDWGSPWGSSKILEILWLSGNTVVHFHSWRDICPNGLHHLLVGHCTMSPEGEENVHVVIFYAEFVHFIKKNRHEFKWVCNTSQVITNKGDLLSGLDNLINWRKTNGVVEDVMNSRFQIFDWFERFCSNLFNDSFFFERKGFFALTIGKLKSLHLALLNAFWNVL